VSKLGRAGLALIAVTVMVPLAGMSAVGASVAAAKQKPVSESKYAKVLCGTYNSVIGEDLDAFTTAYTSAPSDDPVAFQTAAVTAANEFLAQIAKRKAKLAKIYPDVDDGKKIAKIMAGDLSKVKSKVSDALAKFQAADANGVAFQADVTQFEVALQLLGVDTTDLSKVTDQDVIGAIDDEKRCQEIFPVVGG